MKSYKYILNGLDCANCAKKIEDKIASTEGYKNVNVNFSTLKLSFKTDKTSNVKEEISEIVHSLEPDIKLQEQVIEETQRNNTDIIRLVLGITLFLIGMYLNIGKIEYHIITISALIILIAKTAKKAFIQITKNKTLDENALIVISAIGAYIVGKQTEGAMVIFLYEIGKILEARAVNKTRKSIANLMNIKPEYANLKNGEDIIKTNPEKVKIGDIIVVKTGEKIPLDGEIIKGEAVLDNSALTGESKLIEVNPKSKVLSGGINTQGLIEIQVEKTYENSTVNKILELVENATDKKAKTETFVSKAAKIYTPIVIILAILVAVFMPIIIKNVTYSQSIYKALVFLVISCPCSIAISVPLSYFTGIGKSSKKGILIKGSDYLDSLRNINEIIFDKTGTITTGNFKVSDINIIDKNYTEEEILRLFAMGESFSNHPIAKSILKASENIDYDINDVKNFEEIAGKGIKYTYKANLIQIGNGDFINVNQDDDYLGTILYIKKNDDIIGNIVLKDEIKADSKKTMQKLSNLNIITKMFTGDKKQIALEIAKDVGIQEVKAEMLPTEKYNELEKELENTKRKIAYVGDGINDSPVLARADIGISMGGVGSSSAIEASDVVIMTDELSKITEAIDISKKTNKIIKQNLIFSIGVKILTLLLSLFGIADMWQAVFADVGTTLITIFNTVRILK